MRINYKVFVLVLLVVFSAEITVQNGAATFYCHGDICNKGSNDQFCSKIFKLCRNCEEVRMDCGTKNQPIECLDYCFEYKTKLALERQKAANCSGLNTNLQSVAYISQTEYEQGDNITIECSPGYEPSHTNTAQCGQYGLFQISHPTCTVQTCVLAPLIANAKFSPNLDARARANINSTIKVECKDGFTLLGSGTMTCLAKDTWSVDAPFCLPSSYIWWQDFAIILIAVCGTSLVIICVLSFWRYHKHNNPKDITQFSNSNRVSFAETENDLDETSRMIITEKAAPQAGEDKRYSDYSTGSEGCNSCQSGSHTAPPNGNESNRNVTNISTTYNMYGNISQNTDHSSPTAANVDETTNQKQVEKHSSGGHSQNILPMEESQTTIEASQETQQGKSSKGTIPITEDNDTEIALKTVPFVLNKQFGN